MSLCEQLVMYNHAITLSIYFHRGRWNDSTSAHSERWMAADQLGDWHLSQTECETYILENYFTDLLRGQAPKVIRRCYQRQLQLSKLSRLLNLQPQNFQPKSHFVNTLYVNHLIPGFSNTQSASYSSSMDGALAISRAF